LSSRCTAGKHAKGGQCPKVARFVVLRRSAAQYAKGEKVCAKHADDLKAIYRDAEAKRL
jgi:hypothetical protein